MRGSSHPSNEQGKDDDFAEVDDEEEDDFTAKLDEALLGDGDTSSVEKELLTFTSPIWSRAQMGNPMLNSMQDDFLHDIKDFRDQKPIKQESLQTETKRKNSENNMDDVDYDLKQIKLKEEQKARTNIPDNQKKASKDKLSLKIKIPKEAKIKAIKSERKSGK